MTRGRPQGSCLIMGLRRTNTGRKPWVPYSVGQEGNGEEEINAYCASKGFVTLLNSRQAKVPPGLSTRCASRRTSWIEVTFRIPNAIV